MYIAMSWCPLVNNALGEVSYTTRREKRQIEPNYRGYDVGEKMEFSSNA